MLHPYKQIHQVLRRTVGPAGKFLCDCGKPAEEWAYQFTAGEQELRFTDGNRPYSLDPGDYAPMCRTCHVRFDLEHDAHKADEMQAKLARNSAAIAQRRLTDPEFGERNRQNGYALNNIRRRCAECGKTSSPGGLSSHQRKSGHQGWTQEEEN